MTKYNLTTYEIDVFKSQLEKIAETFSTCYLKEIESLIKDEDSKTIDSSLSSENYDYDQLIKKVNISTLYEIKYHTISSCIIQLISLWEQQLFQFLIKEYNCKISNKFECIKCKIKEEFNIELDKKNFKELLTYRDLYNTLKHGKGGYSYRKIQKTRFGKESQIFSEKIISELHTGLVLNISITDINECKNYIIEFWSKLKDIIEKK